MVVWVFEGEVMNTTYLKQPKAFLDKQPSRQAERIEKAINSLPAGDIKKLRGYENMYRLRVGDFRIIFEKDDDNYHVIKIDNRGSVYK